MFSEALGAILLASHLRKVKGNSMKKTIMAMVASIGLATAAAAADLPRRNPAPAPAPMVTEYPYSWYVGLSGGATAGSDKLSFDGSRGVIGGVVGYEFGPFFRTEAEFTNRFSGSGVKDGQMATINAIAQYTISGTRFTPYLLGGVGYGWNAYGNLNGNGAALWAVGGGVRYAVNRNWEVDARYKHVRQFESIGGYTPNENILTAGINYRF